MSFHVKMNVKIIFFLFYKNKGGSNGTFVRHD